MKTNKVVLAVALMLAMAVGAAALSVVDVKTGNFRIPQSEGNGAPDTDARWTGSLVARLEASTTATEIFDGEGLVDGICVASGVADGYAVIGDSSVGANFSVTASGYALHRQPTNPAASASTAAGAGCTSFDPPIRIANGLAVDNSASDIRTIVRYRITKQ